MHYNQNLSVYHAQYFHFSEILKLTHFNSWALVSLSLVLPTFCLSFLIQFLLVLFLILVPALGCTDQMPNHNSLYKISAPHISYVFLHVTFLNTYCVICLGLAFSILILLCDINFGFSANANEPISKPVLRTGTAHFSIPIKKQRHVSKEHIMKYSYIRYCTEIKGRTIQEEGEAGTQLKIDDKEMRATNYLSRYN